MKKNMKETETMTDLTPDLFRQITTNTNDEMIDLKEQQTEMLNSIREEKEHLKQLKIQYKETRKNIKLSKRALRSEKRKLHKTNKTLKIKRNLVTKISADFIKPTEKVVNVKRYVKTRNEG